MHTIAAADLRTFVREILVAAGATEENADRVGEALVSSNLSGVDTHGVFHLHRYVAEIDDGVLDPIASPEILSETPTTALVTCNWTFGHVGAKYAMDLAIRKATEHNVAAVGLVQAMHIGRLGEYAEMAAASGCIGFVWASGYGAEIPAAVPFGGRQPVLHTNPIAMGFPGGEEPPMALDFATTTIAGSKARMAQGRGEQIAPGALVDKEGVSTTDPAAFLGGGALLPFGGHKGYAIMLANEYLGRLLTGADSRVVEGRGTPVMRHQGVTMMAFRADLFQPLADFTAGADALGRQMRAVPPAPGFDEVLVPGDLEHRARTARTRDGIPVADDIWKTLTDVAGRLGVDVS